MLLGLIYFAIVLLSVVAMWKAFAKAGQPGWACLVPFYNIYVLLQIGGKPGWWLVLFLVPVVNLVMTILVLLAVAKAFGKGGGFVVGLILLPFIFWPILGFGGATYTRPTATP